ncbi:RND family transporter [soil metagenome]
MNLAFRPWPVVVLYLVLTLVLGWQARSFEIDASADTLLTPDNALFRQTQVVNERFAPQEFLVVGYRPHDGEVLAEDTFSELARLTAEISRLPRVESVRSLLNVPLPELGEGDLDFGSRALTIERQNVDPAVLSRVFEDHPIYEDLVINDEQTAAALQVLFRADPELERLRGRLVELSSDGASTGEAEALREEVQTLEKELNRRRHVEVEALRAIIAGYDDEADLYLGGVHVLAYQLIRIVRNDLLVFGGAVLLVISLLLWLIFGGLRWVLIPLLCCFVSVTTTIGLFGLLGFKATVVSANFVALQLILTLALVVHVIVQYQEHALRHVEHSRRRLVQDTMSDKLAPILFAGITTSVGFASLLLTGLQPVISFGWMMMIAMIASTVVTLTLCPALLQLFPRGAAPPKRKILVQALDGLRSLAVRRGVLSVAISAVIVAAGAAGAALLDVENSFIDYFRASTQVHEELSFIDRELGGSTPLDIVYEIPESERHPELALTATTAQAIQGIEEALERHSAVGKVLSIASFAEWARKLNDGRPLTEYELTAIYRSMEEALRDDLLGSFFAPETHQVRIAVRIQDSTDDLDRHVLIDSIHGDIQSLGVAPSQYQLTNLFVLYEDILQRLFRSQVLTLGVVVAALLAAFLLLFRSIRIALIAIVPNVVAILVVFGTMGWMRIPLDLMTITIASIAMSVAADYTIHYIHRYRRENRDRSSEESVTRTHQTVGYAILATSLIIVFGFAILALSDFVPSILFGLLTGLAMAVALLANLILLPVLLRRFVPAG